MIWLLLAAAYFLVPLFATLLFSLKSNQTGKCCTLHNYGWVIHNGDFWHTLKISFILALETIVISLAPLRADDLLGAPEGAEAAAGDRVPGARSRSSSRRS